MKSRNYESRNNELSRYKEGMGDDAVMQVSRESLVITNYLVTVVSGFNESGFSEFPGLTNDLPGPNFPNAKCH